MITINPVAERLAIRALAPSKVGLKESRSPKNLAEANVPAVTNKKATDKPAMTAINFFMVLGRWFTQCNEKVLYFLLSVLGNS